MSRRSTPQVTPRKHEGPNRESQGGGGGELEELVDRSY